MRGQADVKRRLIRSVDVLDPRDGALRRNCDLLLDGGRIAAVADAGELAAPGADAIAATGCTALPGLIDCHLHAAGAYLLDPPEPRDLRWIPGQILKNLRALVQGGVTTARDMAGPLRLMRLLRWLSAQGRIAAPRLLIPGPILSTPGGYPTYIPPLTGPVAWLLGPLRIDVGSPSEARRVVDELAAEGVDHVKVAYTSREYDDERTPIPVLPGAVVRAITDRAHHHGLPVAVHHIWALDLPALLELPFDSLEHLSIEAQIPPADVEQIRRRRLPVTTTLMTYGIVDFATELCELVDEDRGERYQRQPAERIATLARELARGSYRVPFIGRQVIETGMRFMLDNLAVLRSAGVLVAAGTDAGGAITPCGKMSWELRAMTRAGLTPLEAVQAATSDAARALDRSDIGLLECGRRADIVLCRGNPAEDLGALDRIEWVLLDGRIMRQPPAA